MKSTKEIEIAGTSLQGHIETTKADLIRAFGEPMNYEDSKVTIEWGIRFEDRTIATIYDWKRYELGTPKDDELMTYHIGGLTPRAVELVKEALEKNKEKAHKHSLVCDFEEQFYFCKTCDFVQVG